MKRRNFIRSVATAATISAVFPLLPEILAPVIPAVVNEKTPNKDDYNFFFVKDGKWVDNPPGAFERLRELTKNLSPEEWLALRED